MGREGRDYWEAQLSEYWDSGLTIQEYSELKELPYESTRRWIRVLQKARQDDARNFLTKVPAAGSECCKRHARMMRATLNRWSW